MNAVRAIILLCALILISPGLAEAGSKGFGGHRSAAPNFSKASGLHRSFHNFRSNQQSRVRKSFSYGSKRHANGLWRKRSSFGGRHNAQKPGHRGDPKRRHHRRDFRAKHVVIYPGYYWGRGRDVVVTQINTTEIQDRGDDTAAPPERRRSFQAKHIHIGDDGTITEDVRLSEVPVEDATGDVADCLSVQKEILVGEQELDAFGKACLQADGTWRLMPDGG